MIAVSKNYLIETVITIRVGFLLKVPTSADDTVKEFSRGVTVATTTFLNFADSGEQR